MLSGRQRDEVLFRFRAVRQALALSDDDLWRLYCSFIDCNKDESGFIKEDELFEYLDADGGPFSQRVYRMFQDSADGISFKNFVVASWSMCTRDKDSLHHFAFQLYDIQGRGELGLADIRLLLSELFGADFENTKAAQDVMKKLIRFDYAGRQLDAHVDAKGFAAVTQARPMMLFPAFDLQRKLQDKTLGARGWEVITKRRDALVKEGHFDITNVVMIANAGRPRRSSVVPVTDKHIMSLSAAAGPVRLATPSGLQKGTKVTAEADYVRITHREPGPGVIERVGDAIAEVVADPKQAAADAVKGAARRASAAGHAVMKITEKALVATGVIDAPKPVIAPRPPETAEDKAKRRASQAAKQMGLGGDEQRSPSPSADPRDYNRVQLQQFAARRRSSVGVYKPGARRGSAANGGGGADNQFDVVQVAGGMSTNMRRASATAAPTSPERRMSALPGAVPSPLYPAIQDARPDNSPDVDVEQREAEVGSNPIRKVVVMPGGGGSGAAPMVQRFDARTGGVVQVDDGEEALAATTPLARGLRTGRSSFVAQVQSGVDPPAGGGGGAPAAADSADAGQAGVAVARRGSVIARTHGSNRLQQPANATSTSTWMLKPGQRVGSAQPAGAASPAAVPDPGDVGGVASPSGALPFFKAEDASLLRHGSQGDHDQPPDTTAAPEAPRGRRASAADKEARRAEKELKRKEKEARRASVDMYAKAMRRASLNG